MYDYQASLESVTDGDTVRYLIDMGMFIRSAHALRLLNVHAPELSELGGKEAKAFVGQWHAEHASNVSRWPYRIFTEKDKQTFNRYIGIVTCTTCGECLNDDINAYLTPKEPTL